MEITAHGACGSCKAREACGLGETGQKIVEIRTPAAATYRPGDRVTVAITRGMGAVAVLLAYVVPFVVLIGVVAVCYLLGAGDGAAVLAGWDPSSCTMGFSGFCAGRSIMRFISQYPNNMEVLLYTVLTLLRVGNPCRADPLFRGTKVQGRGRSPDRRGRKDAARCELRRLRIRRMSRFGRCAGEAGRYLFAFSARWAGPK